MNQIIERLEELDPCEGEGVNIYRDAISKLKQQDRELRAVVSDANRFNAIRYALLGADHVHEKIVTGEMKCG